MRPSRPKKRACEDAVWAVGHGGGVRPTPSTRRYNYNVEDLGEDVGPGDRGVRHDEAPVENLRANEAAYRGDDHDQGPEAAEDHVEHREHDVDDRDDARREAEVEAVLLLVRDRPVDDLAFAHGVHKFFNALQSVGDDRAKELGEHSNYDQKCVVVP